MAADRTKIGQGKPGPGRPKGSKSKLTQKAIAAARATGELPHEFLLRVSRGGVIDGHTVTFDERISAAERAAPFFAPRLATVMQTQLPFDLSKASDEQLRRLEELHRELAALGSGANGAPQTGSPSPTADRRTRH